MTIEKREERREEEINPLANVVVGRKSSSNRSNRSNRIERSSHPMYLNPLIFDAWQQYCRHSGQKHCDLLEGSLIEYMRNHPSPQIKIDVIQDLKAVLPDVQTRLRNKVLRDKISGTVKIMRRLQEKGAGDINRFKAQLQRLVLQATRLKYVDAELLKALEEAEELL